MGADIHSFVEIKKNGKWEKFEEEVFPDYGDKKVSEPFGWRSYSVFGFLANVRNYSHCTPISECKGLPDDSEYLNSPSDYEYDWHGNKTTATKKDDLRNDGDYHSFSWLTAKELLDFDYDSTFENRRYTKKEGNYYDGSAVAEQGQGQGQMISYREHLGSGFFEDLEILKTLGNPEDVRFVFWFDN